jgi:iron(III) transport system substrate-binding protein
MNGMKRRSIILGAAVFGLAALAGPSFAADSVDMAAAKKDGSVVWYTSTPIKTAQKIANAFEAKYGVKVELFRSGGTAILRRFMQEKSAGQVAADVLTTSDPAAMTEMAGKGTFVPFRPEGIDKIPSALQDPKGRWIAQRVNAITIYGRTDIVPQDQMPATWSALTDAKYKGKLVMTDPSFTSLQLGVVSMMSKERGWGFYEKLRANDTMIVPGNQQALDMVKRGERAIAAGASMAYAIKARDEGHPIAIIFRKDGTFVIASPTAIVKGSPHPNAAKLLATYMISMEAQKLLPEGGDYAARTDIAPPKGSIPLGEIKILPLDFDYVAAHSAKVKKKFNEVFQ